MTSPHFEKRRPATTIGWSTSLAALAVGAATSLYAFGALGAGASHTPTVSLTRSVDVDATASEVWAAIGPFCAIKDWLPPVGTCSEDHKSPPTRTLVTRDGAARFVELQTARNDEMRSYSYTFRSSPLPVSNYNATIAVSVSGQGGSTVTWSATYVPDAGKEAEASIALNGVYAAGLDAIRTRFAR